MPAGVSPLQVPLGELQPTLLWARVIAGPDGYTNTAVVVGITAPSGASIVYAVAFSSPGDGSYGIYLADWETYDRDHPLLDQAQLPRTTVSDGTVPGQPVISLLLRSPVNACRTLQAASSLPDGDITENTNGAFLLLGDVHARGVRELRRPTLPSADLGLALLIARTVRRVRRG